MSLPGICTTCRQPVVWRVRLHAWTDTKFRPHVCPPQRALCGAWMPLARERCARRPGHGTEHRTRYALDNALGRAA